MLLADQACGAVSNGNFPFSVTEREALSTLHANPLYDQLYQLIKRRIQSGSLPYGSTLPSASGFSGAFGVSVVTVWRALHQLAAEDMISIGRGRASNRVTFQRKPVPPAAQQLTVNESNFVPARETLSQLLQRDERPAPSGTMTRFGLSASTKLIYTVRVEADPISPIAYCEAWTRKSHKDLLKFSLRLDGQQTSDRQRCPGVARVEQHVSACTVTMAAVNELQIVVGEPVIHIERLFFDSENHLLQSASYQCRPERYRLQIDQRLTGSLS